jgi:RNA polymerase sigma-70 factor (sigma-E family)
VQIQSTARDTDDDAVTALYRAHALSLIRLAYVMLGDRGAAEDVVQDAFAGLHRRWRSLSDSSMAVFYLRSSVLNGCRSALRRGRLARGHVELVDHADLAAMAAPPSGAASFEERRALMDAVRRLPRRQREALVLRFYLDEPDADIARLMGIRESTVRSTTHRALAALGRMLEEES